MEKEGKFISDVHGSWAVPKNKIPPYFSGSRAVAWQIFCTLIDQIPLLISKPPKLSNGCLRELVGGHGALLLKYGKYCR